MAILVLKLTIPFERYDLENHTKRFGPVFHRWLPDGETDALSINAKSKYINIKIWFERCGYMNNGWIKFDCKKREIDPSILLRQAKIDAGPLHVKMCIKNLNSNAVESVYANKRGDEGYIKIGKKIISILNDNLIPFVNTLRFQFGQYWIRELLPWNSQKESLGHYFIGLHTKWAKENEESWQEFIPDEIKSTAHLNIICGKDFSHYFSKDDWEYLNNFQPENHRFGLTHKVLLNAHELREQGNYKQCFIESITSLELSISEYMKNRLSIPKELKKEIESFWQMPIRSQTTVLAMTLPSVSYTHIKNTVEAIKIRNKIVHEGFSPNGDFEDKKLIDSVFFIISKLLSEEIMKFPSCSDSGNTLLPTLGT